MTLGWVLAAALSAQIETEIPNRYHELMERYARDFTEAEARYRADLVGKVLTDGGEPVPEARIWEAHQGAAGRLTRARDGLEEGRTQWRERRFSLQELIARCNWSMEQALQAAVDGTIAEVSWDVQEIQGRQIRDVRELYARFRTRQQELGQREFSTAREREAAEAALRQEFLREETTLLQTAVRQHGEVTRRLVERRRVLAGDVWALEDFHVRRQRDADARRYRELVYRHHAHRLGRVERGADSTLDFFVNMPGSGDRLILRQNFGPPIPTLHKMNAALDSEPVEGLRRYDTTLPSLNFPGSDMEQIARLLTARLTRYYRVQGEQEGVMRRLAELGRQADGLAPVTADLQAVQNAWGAYGRAADEVAAAAGRRQAAANEEREAGEALTRSERELATAQQEVFFDSRNRPVARGTRGATAAARRLEEKREMIRNLEATAALAGTPAADRRRILEEVVPERRRELAEIEAAIARVLERPTRAVEQARRRRDEARAATAALPPPPDPAGVARAYGALRTAYTAAREAFPEADRRTIAALPAAAEQRSAGIAEGGLGAMRVKLRERNEQRAALRTQMIEALGEVGRNDSELHLLVRSASALRVAAANRAAVALESLGAQSTDPVIEEIVRMRGQLNEVKELLETADGRLEKLERIRARLTRDDRGAWLIEGAQERLGTISRTLEFVGDTTDRLLTLRQLHSDLQDPRTTLRGISTMLELGSSAAGSVPVLGQTLGRFFSYYAQAAAACGEAAVAIQDRLIEQNLRAFFSHPPPELHLYTQQEVDANSSLGNQDALNRIATMLQARRLLHLVRANSLGDVTERTR